LNVIMNIPYNVMIRSIFFSLVSVVLFLSCATDNNEIAEKENLEYEALTNVSYGNDPKQKYDIYLPKNRTKDTKVLLLVHGGGWREGDKLEMNSFRDFFREQLPDIAIVNMNYRLADANHPPHPMQINDITKVVDDLKAKGKTYQIGTDLGFVGVSAGAHLSLLWSYAYDTNNQIKMVCSIVGPTNLADEAYSNSENQELKDLIFQFGTDIDVLKSVSPLYQVTASAPPTILFYGGQDPLIPNSQGIDLNQKLTELGVTQEFTFYPNSGHGWLGLELLDTSIKLRAFIENHF